jgi:C1A family cysteine protease
VIGWDVVKGNEAWIFENTWGPDWGQNGYGLIAFEESTITQFAIGFAQVPIPQYQLDEYRKQQQLQEEMKIA